MHVSSTTSSYASQLQSAAPKKVDAESKVEGNKPDGDNDADDKAVSAVSSAVTGNLGNSVNVYA